ncbi:MAG: NYN domain-containing protein [Candidatus Rokubacteria bacterium]|nr:NYN domain-containing protein [Candidatus Rokubacteria bacterium]
MRWLIDGYNVIRRDALLASRELESLQAGREALLRLLGPAAQRTGDQFVVVFDGAGIGRVSGERPGAVRALFSRPGETADQVLARLAARAGAGTAVVSSDRAVRQAAVRAGAIAVAAEEFVSRLTRGSPGMDEVDKDEEEEEPLPPQKGNPRRAKKRERNAQRALARLDPGRRRPGSGVSGCGH